jgi:hypothetical protein
MFGSECIARDLISDVYRSAIRTAKVQQDLVHRISTDE